MGTRRFRSVLPALIPIMDRTGAMSQRVESIIPDQTKHGPLNSSFNGYETVCRCARPVLPSSFARRVMGQAGQHDSHLALDGRWSPVLDLGAM